MHSIALRSSLIHARKGSLIFAMSAQKFWLAGALLAAALSAAPAQAFRCGSRLVSEGDTRAAVRAKCGEPADVEHRSVWRQPVVWVHGRPYHLSSDQIEIPVESWVYNLGPNKLMRRLRFEDGVVVEIETLGYGYYESAASRHSP
jgi:Protein of unknown function (DUF2845)